MKDTKWIDDLEAAVPRLKEFAETLEYHAASVCRYNIESIIEAIELNMPDVRKMLCEVNVTKDVTADLRYDAEDIEEANRIGAALPTKDDMKLINHTETDYDFCLEYFGQTRHAQGDSIESGVVDDNGTRHTFEGSAIVVVLRRAYARTGEMTVSEYCKIIPRAQAPCPF